MLPKTPMLDAMAQGNFEEAEKLILSGERIPDNVHAFDLVQLYEKLLSRKAFSVVRALTSSKQIVTDLYEIDRYDDSIFKPMISRMPVDDESVAFVREFIGGADNINDDVKGVSLLGYAFETHADPRIIEALIAGGCRVDTRNTAEDSLISQAVRINMIKPEKQIEYVALLVREGVDIRDKNVAKQSALHIAVERDKNHLIDILLANGAEPNEQDDKGNTPYFYALAHKFNALVYSKMAAHTPPDFTLTNRDKQTALSEYLRMMPGSDSDLTLLAQLIDDGADLNQSTPYYNEPTSGWDWIIGKRIEMIEMALKKTGFDVNTQDDNGNTLLHKICRIDSNYSHDHARNTYKKVKFLLDAGADASITNTRDETAMMLAAKDNLKSKTVELLLSAKR